MGLLQPHGRHRRGDGEAALSHLEGAAMTNAAATRDMLDVMISEQKARDEELKFLKDCQVRYFYLAVVATAAVLSLLPHRASLPLNAPLLIVLPCWWIFFDKATTISRIVSYKRLLETALIEQAKDQPARTFKYVGWETALSYFREHEKELKKKYGPKRSFACVIALTFKLFFLRHSHKYWMLNFYTFSILSISILLISSQNDKANGLSILYSRIIIGLLTYIFLSTITTVYSLVFGNNSYYVNEQVWKHLPELLVK
jgi:hypothetical protein